jgi:phenylacetate-CoA ligase
MRHWFLKHGMTLSSYLGYPVGKAVKLLGDSEYWTAEEIRTHQHRALNALMEHCYEHVPYYRNLMKARDLRPDSFRSISDLAKLPYLTRDLIRDHAASLRADNFPDALCQFRRSGGTTGEPIRIAVDVRGRAFEVAAYLRGLEWMNHELGRPLVCLVGGSLGLDPKPSLKTLVREWLLNSRFLSAFEITPENVTRYVATIRQATGGALTGYASAALNLAEYMSRRGLQGSPLQSVMCTAEYIPEEWRIRISEVLGVPVFCFYGCGELNSIGYECSGENGYIVPQEHLILEVGGCDPTKFLDEGRGEACVTTLYNYAMPLIRYLNGDILELKYPKSGRAHLRIVKLEGRIMDQLVATDGHRVSSVLPTHLVFKSGVPVWKYQVIQLERDKLIFRYLVRNGDQLTNNMQDLLTSIFRKFLGNTLQVEFVEGGFQTSSSRKHRFVINQVPGHIALEKRRSSSVDAAT